MIEKPLQTLQISLSLIKREILRNELRNHLVNCTSNRQQKENIAKTSSFAFIYFEKSGRQSEDRIVAFSVFYLFTCFTKKESKVHQLKTCASVLGLDKYLLRISLVLRFFINLLFFIFGTARLMEKVIVDHATCTKQKLVLNTHTFWLPGSLLYTKETLHVSFVCKFVLIGRAFAASFRLKEIFSIYCCCCVRERRAKENCNGLMTSSYHPTLDWIIEKRFEIKISAKDLKSVMKWRNATRDSCHGNQSKCWVCKFIAMNRKIEFNWHERKNIENNSWARKVIAQLKTTCWVSSARFVHENAVLDRKPVTGSAHCHMITIKFNVGKYETHENQTGWSTDGTSQARDAKTASGFAVWYVPPVAILICI